MITRGDRIALGIGVTIGLAYTGLRYSLKALAASADRAEAIYLARTPDRRPS